jgi:hypothetical protein
MVGTFSKFRLSIVFLLIFTGLSFTLAFNNAVIKAEDTPRFGIKPAVSGTSTTSNGYFELEGQPGEVLSEAVLVQNPGNTPVKLQVYPVDATTGQRTGISYLARNDLRKGIGAWVVLEKETVEILPQQQIKIPFKLNIPENATPGQHLGGIAVQLVDNSNTTTNTQNSAGTSFGITTVTRVLTAVQINVGGKVDLLSLKINGSAISEVDGKAALTLSLKNDGTGFIKPKGAITLTDSEGKKIISTPLSLSNILPQDSIAYPVPGNLPEPGTYKVHVSLDFGGSAPAVYDGQVEVKALAKAPATTATQPKLANTPVGQVQASSGQAQAVTNNGSATTPTGTGSLTTAGIPPANITSSDNNSMLLGILIGITLVFGLTTLGFGGYIFLGRAKKGNRP